MPFGFERAGRRGVVVEFRDWITNDLLWSSPMDFLPKVDDILRFAEVVGGETPVYQEYEVQEVKFLFVRFTTGELQFTAEKPQVLVKLGT